MITKHTGNPAWVTLSPLWLFSSVSPLKTNRTRHPATPKQIKAYFPLEHLTIDSLHCCKPAPARVCRHYRLAQVPGDDRALPAGSHVQHGSNKLLVCPSEVNRWRREGSPSSNAIFWQNRFHSSCDTCSSTTRPFWNKGNKRGAGTWCLGPLNVFGCIPRGVQGRNAGQWEDKCVSWQ